MCGGDGANTVRQTDCTVADATLAAAFAFPRTATFICLCIPATASTTTNPTSNATSASASTAAATGAAAA